VLVRLELIWARPPSSGAVAISCLRRNFFPRFYKGTQRVRLVSEMLTRKSSIHLIKAITGSPEARTINTIQLLRAAGRPLAVQDAIWTDPLFFRCIFSESGRLRRPRLKRSPTPGHGVVPLPSGTSIPAGLGADKPFFRPSYTISWFEIPSKLCFLRRPIAPSPGECVGSERTLRLARSEVRG
jgi:hypothetical protein